MANTQHLFEEFNTRISINSTKKSKMAKSKTGLRETIKVYFKEKHPEYVPQFYIQGSYKMKTGIRTKDDICDVDDGVYFMREPDVSPSTLQKWIWDAVEDYTNTKPEHREKCIRNIFVNDYEIDIPVYYKVDGKEYQLATKNKGWRNDDPKAMVDWFLERKDVDGHLLKIVKFLKAWCDFKQNKMPSGLALTILATNAKPKIIYNIREDINLRDTLREIQKTLKINFQCIVPATPNDDLFADYDPLRKDNFMNALDTFIIDADEAIKEVNELNSSKLWKKHLGDRFPEGEDKDDVLLKNPVLLAGAKTSTS